MINRVVLVGRLTKDIELRKTPSNLSVCRFTVACDRRVKSKDGTNSADFITCVAWNQSADFLAQYASKGSVVAIDGRITTGSYEGQNGRVFTTEVTCESVRIIGGNRNNNNNMNNTNNYSSYNNNYSTNNNMNQTFTPSNEASFSENDLEDDFSNTPSLDISSDDLPFY